MQPIRAANSPPLSALLRRLWDAIPSRRRGQFGLVLGLMVLASFAEVISLGAVLPFLGVLTSPETVFHHPAAQGLVAVTGAQTPRDLLLPITILFACAAVLNGTMRLTLLWCTMRLTVLVGAELSHQMYRRTLYQPYAVHIARNSSEIINTITAKSGMTIYILNMIMNLSSSSIILVAVLSALLAVDTQIALLAMAGFSTIYLVVIRFTRRSLVENSRRVARETDKVIKALQEGLGGIRDVLLDGNQEVFSEIYRRSDTRARVANGNSGFLSGSPRFAVEALAMIFIAGLAYYMATSSEGLARAIPVLGALALGAQRMLPVLQQGYAALSEIRGHQSSLADALDLLEQPLPDWFGSVQPQIAFQKDIVLKNVVFRYGETLRPVLNGLNLSIARGARVGFIGQTGSGKSTLLDVVMGLLVPNAGQICIDGTALSGETIPAWQTHVAHVPQSVFLADASIAANIAFGVPPDRIDMDRVKRAADQAQILATALALPNGFDTVVGERGVSLSGGQRQRIGIARALYKNADVIIFDEATSALDTQTEHAVMQAIEQLDKNLTVLMIAHRVSTLRNCDIIYDIKGGQVCWSGSYAALSQRKTGPSAATPPESAAMQPSETDLT